EPDPTFFQVVKDLRAELRDEAGQGKTGNAAGQPEELPPGKIASNGQPDGDSRSDAGRTGMTSQEFIWQNVEIPVGWFHVGRKCDVPQCACYVGRHCDTYVWVTSEGMNGLSRFTLIVLAIT